MNTEILVVDDNANNLRLLRSVLIHQGAHVRLATSGEMAVKSAQAHPPDLILLDINLSGIDGFETCRQLKADAALRDVPVIFLSALAEGTEIVKAFEAGGVDYVTKPFVPEVLLARVNTHLTISRLQRELRQENLERLAAEKAAEAANRAKSGFLATMSHELRTPMNSIIGMARLALRTGLDAQQHGYIDKVHRSAESLLGLINDILDFSKIEAGKLEIEHAEFRLGDVMENLAGLLGIKAEDKNLELLFAEPPGLPPVLIGDSLRLGQVLINLGNNAVKFTDRGEVIVGVVELERDAASVVLQFSVRDTGAGIDPQLQPRLFTPFTQADVSTSRRHGGTGLGLAICAQLVQLMGGRIWFDSEEGQGSTFHFTARFGLPPVPSSQPVVALPAENLLGSRVLVVDDNATARTILVDMCNGLGFRADAVADGWDALRAIATEAQAGRPYDLVLIDWRMPGMDGVELVRHLARARGSKPPAVMMITAFGRAELMQRLAAENLSVSGVLTKPVTPSTLLDSAARALGGAPLAETRQEQRSAAMDGDRDSLRGARLLLVEDHEFNQELAIELLQEAGIEVTLAEHGQRALELLEQQRFDGVLMDCQMPVMDGYTATRLLRQRPEWSHLPVIAMTANALVGEREKVLAAGMNDYIPKPLDVGQMFAVIARWVKPRREAPPPAVPAGELPEMPGIDTKLALAKMAGNKALYRRLLVLFRESRSDFGERLRAARDAADAAALARLAHAMKGSAGTIGATAVQTSAARLEDACSGEIDACEVDRLCDALVAELDAVLKVLPTSA